MTSSKAVFVACVLAAGAAMSSLLTGCTEGEPSSDPSSVAQGCGDGGACVQTGVIAPAAGAAAALPDALPSRYPFWILQMNLCNSGFASCYDGGKSIPEAAAAIQNSAPDIVTLNEICQPDVVQLATTLSGVYSGSTVVWAFKAATDRRTNAAYKCKNGQDYGIGLVAHIPAPYNGYQTFSGIYASQDTSSAEERAWLCLYATGNFYACTTHLASTSGTVALAQCKNLMTTIIPSVRAPGGYEPTVLGGDLNLKYQGSPDAQSCVPAGYYRKGDGDVQHVMATTDLVFSSSHTIAMSHTDHPGWFVAVTAP
ncbi:MAG TPA: hypothetical protein VH165_26430 [Kofleriaceae bacterium]|nr:hypothetical protein [Kofleriaceae bacterium]